MKTIKDIIDIVAKLYFTESRKCDSDSCYYCKKLSWCYIDSHILAMDYLARGEYYG